MITTAADTSSESVLQRLERSCVEEFIRARGHDPQKLDELPAPQRDALLKAASMYASGRMGEVESRSRLLHELHDVRASTLHGRSRHTP